MNEDSWDKITRLGIVTTYKPLVLCYNLAKLYHKSSSVRVKLHQVLDMPCVRSLLFLFLYSTPIQPKNKGNWFQNFFYWAFQNLFWLNMAMSLLWLIFFYAHKEIVLLHPLCKCLLNWKMMPYLNNSLFFISFFFTKSGSMAQYGYFGVISIFIFFLPCLFPLYVHFRQSLTTTVYMTACLRLCLPLCLHWRHACHLHDSSFFLC